MADSSDAKDDNHILEVSTAEQHWPGLAHRITLPEAARAVCNRSDNDGNPDIFYVTGNIYPEIEASIPNYPFRTPRVMFRNLGNGRLEELIEEGDLESQPFIRAAAVRSVTSITMEISMCSL